MIHSNLLSLKLIEALLLTVPFVRIIYLLPSAYSEINIKLSSRKEDNYFIKKKSEKNVE